MGIVSAIGKLVVKGVQKVGGKTLAKGVKNAGRVVKAAPDFIFGTGGDAARKAMKTTSGSIFTKAKSAAKAVVKQSEKAAAKDGNFFKRMWKSLKSTPKDINRWRKVGVQAAERAGKNKFLGGAKGVMKAIGTKMPLINSLIILATETPNIIDATKNEGIGAGLKEAGKATVGLVGATLGYAFGGFLGVLGGAWAASKLTGETYSEKKAFLEENGVTEEAIAVMKDQGYTFDQIYELAKAEVEAAKAQENLVQTQQEVSGEQPAEQQEVAQGQEAAQPAQGGTVAQQPAQEQQVPVTQPVTGQQEVAQPTVTDGQQVVQGGYSEDGVAILRELGVSDADLAALQQSGIPIEEAVRMVVNIKSQNPAATVPATATDNTTVQQPVAQQPVQVNTPAFKPFQRPYDSMTVSNPYANDIFYKSLFGETPAVGSAEQNAYSINPNQQQRFLKYSA